MKVGVEARSTRESLRSQRGSTASVKLTMIPASWRNFRDEWRIAERYPPVEGNDMIKNYVNQIHFTLADVFTHLHPPSTPMLAFSGPSIGHSLASNGTGKGSYEGFF